MQRRWSDARRRRAWPGPCVGKLRPVNLLTRLLELDVALFKKIVGARSQLLDKVLYSASAAANRSRLWMCIAAVLAGAGGRFGKRAALRGVLSVGMTSLVANLPLKMLARRGRPDRRTFPTIPLLRRGPASFSFPSGHSASAAAFTTGVSLEMPKAAVPLAALASAVGYSRVYTGVHYPGDVVAGAALGLGIGLSTARFWPVAPHDPAKTRPAFQPVQGEPSPQGAGVAIVVNPLSGPAMSVDPVEQLSKELPQASIVELDEEMDLMETLNRACRQARVIGIAGGDGSINLGATVAHEENKPMLVIPSGTLNHFARALGLETLADAVEAIRSGQAVAVDLGMIDGRPFLNTSSFGSYVDLVDVREKLEPKIGKWPAVIAALVRVLRRSQRVDVEINGRRRLVWMVFAGNCRYKPSGFAPSWRERLDDGLLDVRIVDANEPWSRTRLVLSVLTGRLARSALYEQFTTRQLSVRSLQGSLRLARDGETFQGSKEFSITKSARRVAVFVPRASLPPEVTADENGQSHEGDHSHSRDPRLRPVVGLTEDVTGPNRLGDPKDRPYPIGNEKPP
jgi:diacylglycerol kinase family enzyme/membrane-associated phospholipid phosphatase